MLKKCLVIGMVVILLVSIGGVVSCQGYPKAPEDVVKELYLCTSKMDYEGCKRFFQKTLTSPRSVNSENYLSLNWSLSRVMNTTK
ncbi:hypothetical protein ES708_02482 [subsurface metagenome]